MSRQELAEAVNAWCAQHTNTVGALDAHYVGRLEQGRVHRPHRDYRAGFCAVLGASDTELGFAPAPPRRGFALGAYPRSGGEEDDDMRRRAFLAAASAALFAHPDLIETTALPEHEPPLPTRLGAADVAALRDTAVRLQEIASQHDSYAGLLAPTVSHAERLLSVPASDTVRHGLFSVAGELHRMAGWSAFDARAGQASRAHFGRSMQLCAAGHDTYGAAWASMLAGVAAGERDHSEDALHLFRMAHGKLLSANLDDPRVPGMTARLHVDMARALIGLGDDAGSRSELAAAWDTHGGDTIGLAYMSALVTRAAGDLDAAEQYAQQAAEECGHGPFNRAALSSRIILAVLQVTAGEESGVVLAERVIRDVDGVRSQRVRHRLGRLAHALENRGHHELAATAYEVCTSPALN